MYGYDSPEDLLADLGRQRYVESDRRRKLR